MGGRSTDPRALALAGYLRDRAAAFSLSADSTGEPHLASAGMALLDAALLAENLPPLDQRLHALSAAGRFETMADGASRFVESADLRAVVQRPASGPSMSGEEILSLLIITACGE
jgi:hypothetical protein